MYFSTIHVHRQLMVDVASVRDASVFDDATEHITQRAMPYRPVIPDALNAIVDLFDLSFAKTLRERRVLPRQNI